MIPLQDRNPTSHFAFVTALIMAACIWIFFYVQPTGQQAFMARSSDQQVEEITWTLRNAAVPCELTHGRPLTVPEVVRTFNAGDTTACLDNPRGHEFAPEKNVYLAVLYSMFLHGRLLHLFGTTLFLGGFRNTLEDRMRPLG